jgi:hypothetical protein
MIFIFKNISNSSSHSKHQYEPCHFFNMILQINGIFEHTVLLWALHLIELLIAGTASMPKVRGYDVTKIGRRRNFRTRLH